MRIAIVFVTLFFISYASRAEGDWFHDFSDGELPTSLEILIPRVFPFPHLSQDGLTIYFGSDSPASNDELPEIYMATRASLDEPFGPRERVGGTPGKATFLGSLANDELALYYRTFVPRAAEQTAHVVTRNSTDVPFDFRHSKAITEINAVGSVIDPGHVANDGLSIYFTVGGGGPDSGSVAGAYVATRQHVDEPFGDPVRLSEVGAVDYVTEDELVLFSVSEDDDPQAPIA